MKYNININQKALYELSPELDITDGAILDYLYIYSNSKNKKIDKERIKDESGDWTWLNYGALLENMPLLKIKSKAALSQRIKKIEQANYITTKRVGHQKLFVRMDSKIDELFVETNRAICSNKQSYLSKQTNNKNKDNNKDNTLSAKADDEKLTFKIVPTKPYLAIIFTYAEAKGIVFDNEKQKQSFISRNVRVAKTLEGYSLEKIKAWCYILPYLEMKKYTLETVGKFLDDDPLDIIMRYREDDYREVCDELEDEGILKKVGHEYKLNV